MAKDTELSKERFSRCRSPKIRTSFQRRVREYLRGILYHNLAKVDYLYGTAVGIPILSLAGDKALLFEVITRRHDCVHRNGFDKDGKKLTVFTKQYVQDTADLIKDFVEKIEGVNLNHVNRDRHLGRHDQRQGPPRGGLHNDKTRPGARLGYNSLWDVLISPNK